jgi:hypothetical protein
VLVLLSTVAPIPVRCQNNIENIPNNIDSQQH